MTTVRGKLEKMLTDLGMFESQAKEVLEISIPKINNMEVNKNYNVSWNACSSGYPQVIYNILFMTIKVDARDWIAKNKPEAWFRPMFELSPSEVLKIEDFK
jgi:hypothetical protein